MFSFLLSIIFFDLIIYLVPLKIKKYNLNKDCVFTIPIISLKDFNGDEIINNIEYKIRNNILIQILLITQL